MKSSRKATESEPYLQAPSTQNLASDTEESSSEVEVKRKKRKKKRMKQKKRGKENKKAGEKSKVKWSNERIFRLIELYEERPCLWVVFSQHYHNRETTSIIK